MLAGLVMLPVAGHITDHTDRVRLLALAGFLSSVFLVPMVLAPNWQVVAVATLLFGSVVFQFPAYASLVADSLSPADRGRGIGAMNTISSSLAIVAPYIAGVIVERFSANLGVRILYAVMLVTYVCSSLIQLRFLREGSSTPREPLRLSAVTRALGQAYQVIPALVRQMSPALRALASVVLLSFLANGVTGAFWVVYATNQIGLSATEWGLILLVEAVVRLVAFLPGGLLVDRWGRRNPLLVALAISSVTVPLFVVVKSFAAILLLRAAIAVTSGLAVPACMALMADLIPRSLRGQIMAAIGQGGIMIGMAGGVGGPALGYLFIPPVMIASLAGGYLYALHPAYPWLFALVATLLALIVTILFVQESKKAEI
jgi:MFS family permease